MYFMAGTSRISLSELKVAVAQVKKGWQTNLVNIVC
jgi:hypothetical protein